MAASQSTLMLAVALSCLASAGACADAAADKIAAMRNGWERCALFAMLNQTGKAEAAAETAMRLCIDEEKRYRKALTLPPVGFSAPTADDATKRVREDILMQMIFGR